MKPSPKTDIQSQSHFKINNSNKKPIKPKLSFPSPSNLKSTMLQNTIKNKTNKIDKKVNSIINQNEIDPSKIPQDTKEPPKNPLQIENGDKNIQKKTIKKNSLRTFKR